MWLSLLSAWGCDAATRSDSRPDARGSVPADEVPVDDVPTPAPAPNTPVIGPGSDAPPSRPATPGESRSAAPWWAGGVLVALSQKERRELFERAGAAPTERGSIESGTIVCRVGAPSRTDGSNVFSAPDLRTIVTIGSNARRSESGDEDVAVMYTAIPMATLRTGDVIRVQVVDRDFWDDTSLGAVNGVYSGTLPWKRETRRLEVECRVLEGAALDVVVAEGLAACDEFLARIADATVFDAGHPDFGFERSRFDMARKVLAKGAALVGYGDRRVLRRVEWLARIERQLFEPAAVFVKATVASSPPASTVVPLVTGLQGQVTRLSCGSATMKRARQVYRGGHNRFDAHGDCMLEMAIENRSSATLRSRHDTSLVLEGSDTRIELDVPRLILASGEVVALKVLLLQVTGGEKGRVEPGEAGMLWLIPTEPVPPLDEASGEPVLVSTGVKQEGWQEPGARVFLRVTRELALAGAVPAPPQRRP